MLLENTSAAALSAADSTFASTTATAGAVRLSTRKPSGDYVKVEVGEQTLIAELKAELSGLRCDRSALRCFPWPLPPVTIADHVLSSSAQVLLLQSEELEDQRTILGSGLSRAVLHAWYLKSGIMVRTERTWGDLIAGGLKETAVTKREREAITRLPSLLNMNISTAISR